MTFSRRRTAGRKCRLLISFFVLTFTGSLSAQQPVQQAAFIQPQPPAAAAGEIDLTVEGIESRRKAAAGTSDLDDDTKKKVEDLYAQSVKYLEDAAKWRTQSALSRTLTENVKQRAQALNVRLEKLRAELEKLRTEESRPATVGLDLSDLQADQARRTSRLAELKKELEAAESEDKKRLTRNPEIISRQEAIGQRREELQKEIDTPSPNELPAVTDARRTRLLTERIALEEELIKLRDELAQYKAEEVENLTRLQRDASTEEVALAQKELQLLLDEISDRQSKSDVFWENSARYDVDSASDDLLPIAKRNLELVLTANALTKLADDPEDAGPAVKTLNDLEKTTARLDGVRKQFELIRQKVESLGLTRSIGDLLRRERSGLPNVPHQQSRIHERRTVIEEQQFNWFGYEDDRAELANRDAAAEKALSEIATASGLNAVADLPEGRREELTEDIRQALDFQADCLDRLINRSRDYVNNLYALDLKERQLIKETEAFRDYIDERVLWIRSNAPLHQSVSIEKADRFLTSPMQWSVVLKRLVEDAGEYLVLFGLSVLISAILIIFRPRMRRELASVGAIARKGTCSTIMPTIRAGWLTVLLSMLWPTMTLLVGLRMATVHEGAFVNNSAFFGRAVGYGLQSLAIVGLSLEFLRNVCRPHGLADDHFDWPDSTITVFRRSLPKLTVLALPIAFLTTTLYHCDEDHGTDFPERVCFILGTIVLSMFLRRTLRPKSGVLCEYLSSNRGGWLDRLKPLWYWGGVLSPLVLGGLAASGFYYTAYQLAWRLFATILFVVAVQLVRAFLQRLLIVQQRRIHIDQLRQKREEAARAAEEQADDAPATPLASVPLDELRADVEASTEQSRRLLRTALIMLSLVGVWVIWVDVLPALRFLDRWPVWWATVEVSETETASVTTPSPTGVSPVATDSAMTATDEPREEVIPVTIVHLTVAILIAILTIAAARNVPGLMELWVLQKLPLDQSVRYAIRALTSYAIVLIGIIFSFKAIYVGWSQVQWLATALTFGLAFGLQEIFANFVAGLILLFERPIRVGDVVTVDDVSGVVSRIRIRATTITNWDRKEYVIPNKEFITGRMLNWTLSDKVNRIVINVGIAYGSDTEQARSLLLQICHEHPLLLDDPPPVVTFEGFGDNTLNLVVRTYLPDLDNRLGTIHELHTRINDEFNREGIEIAFPQRDLHIRSIDENAARRLRGESTGD